MEASLRAKLGFIGMLLNGLGQGARLLLWWLWLALAAWAKMTG